MNKLIELLNKAHNSGAELFGHRIGNFERAYYSENHWRLRIDTLGYTDENYETYFYSDRDICGKDGGFIKWLVDNDKIEINNLSLKAFKNIFSGGGFVEVSDLEVLLMLLAISDTPIDDLISYLR